MGERVGDENLCYWHHLPHCPGAATFGNGQWRTFTLLADQKGNAKAAKSEKVGQYTAVLHLAPADLSGQNMCPWSTPGCRAACLNTAGRGGMSNVQEARVAKTLRFKSEGQVNPTFMATLARDVEGVRRLAAKRGMAPAVRLNGTSDQPWEAIGVTVEGREYKNLMAAYPDVQFYDYTKSATRALRSVGGAPGSESWPANYHLTYSVSEDPKSQEVADKVLGAGGNASVVFRDRIPAEWRGHRVVDATKHDARYLDPPGTVAGLRALGAAKGDQSGFVVDVAPDAAELGHDRRRARRDRSTWGRGGQAQSA